MSEPYEVFLRSEAIEALSNIRGSSRRRIAAFIDSLKSNPFQLGDYPIQDNTGRGIYIKIVGAFAVTYWADHAVKEIRVTDIRSADRP